jgi:hypothetical protein
VAPRGVDDPPGPGQRRGEGLLDEDGLAGLEGGDGEVGVLRVRRRDVDDVDGVVVEQFAVGAVRAGRVRAARTGER